MRSRLACSLQLLTLSDLFPSLPSRSGTPLYSPWVDHSHILARWVVGGSSSLASYQEGAPGVGLGSGRFGSPASPASAASSGSCVSGASQASFSARNIRVKSQLIFYVVEGA